MSRRRNRDAPEEGENHDRWLVSYADFITLLFAFFVVMYAISSVNENKYRVLSESLGAAFGRTPPVTMSYRPADTVVQPELPPLPKKPRLSEAMKQERQQMTAMAQNILRVLQPLVQEGKVRVTQQAQGITVEINASVLFAPGEARLADESSQALKAVAQVLKDDHHAVQVEGHTDDTPINTIAFPSNWELSAVRASSVVRLFVQSGVQEQRLSAVGYGATRPVGDNSVSEGRLRNRRVQIMILANLPDKAIEVPIPALPAAQAVQP